MKIHEYQGKEILRKYGVTVPRGIPCMSVEEAVKAAETLGGPVWVVKAQIHAGGRGKGGGVKVAKSMEQVREYAEAIMGMQLITHQTSPEGQKVRRLLIEENPQVGAIILTVLTPDVAGDALSGLDETLQAELVYRAARLTSVPAAAIEDLEAILVQTANAETGQGGMKLGGKSDAAKIVNSLPKALGERVLRSVKKRDRLLAEAIEEEMFVFENLNDLDAKNLGTVLCSVDANALSLALKGADGATTDRFLATMSARAAQTIRDEMSEMEMVKRTDVEDAQRVIIAVARQLAAEGTIIMSGKGDDYV